VHCDSAAIARRSAGLRIFNRTPGKNGKYNFAGVGLKHRETKGFDGLTESLMDQGIITSLLSPNISI